MNATILCWAGHDKTPASVSVEVPAGLSEPEARVVARMRHCEAAHVCACGHGQGEHDIRKDGSRGRCWTSTGPSATPCGCLEFTPRGQQ